MDNKENGVQVIDTYSSAKFFDEKQTKRSKLKNVQVSEYEKLVE